ncbi:MAG: endolytic transglycosylase MltG [Kofleriaceae bacterium]
MSKRSFRGALGVVLGSLLIVGIVIAVMVSRALSYPDQPHEGTGVDVEVEIKSGASFPQVAAVLAEKGVIAKPSWFRLYGMMKGDTKRVKSGKYLIKDNLTPSEVLAILVKGVKEVTIKVTLPEGKNMLEFFELIATACPEGLKPPCPTIAAATDLEKLARDKDFLAKHAIAGDSIEGYLFPDTYQFQVGEKPVNVLEHLIERHQKVWNETVAKYSREAAKLKAKLSWTDRDILTMASIVEKEAVDPAERPRIAQVFINRLTFSSFKSRRLETDPTIRYGCMVAMPRSAACEAWHEPCRKAVPPKPLGCDRLHRAQLDDRDNLYNTYQHAGLPPGPIANPGRRSIEAVFAPDGSDYLYFVAKDARSHVFSKTFAEHTKAVDKYQR